jgi:hypothetical protein
MLLKHFLNDFQMVPVAPIIIIIIIVIDINCIAHLEFRLKYV